MDSAKVNLEPALHLKCTKILSIDEAYALLFHFHLILVCIGLKFSSLFFTITVRAYNNTTLSIEYINGKERRKQRKKNESKKVSEML